MRIVETTMATTTGTAKRERLEARITAEQKELFQLAANLEGRSLTDFVVQSVQAAAEDAIRRHQVIRLSVRDSLTFAELIANPPPPNEHLRAAFARYRESVTE
jgi:uncharacterized protein (DUF1778 family)